MLTRVLSALVLIPVAVGAVVLGGWWLVAFLLLALGLATWEYAHLMQQGGLQPAWWMALLLMAALVTDAMLVGAGALYASIGLILIASLAWHMSHRTATVTADWALTIAGGLYFGWAGRQFVAIRGSDDGLAWLLLVFTATWLADSGAYLVGSRIGRHKMAPTLSPKKSWEGLIGGIVFAVIGNALIAALLQLPPLHGAALGLIGGLIGTLGDLSISMMKRQVGAKDSGHLIPGHGGVLDRLDSLLLVGIAAQLYLAWFVYPRPA